MLPEGLTIDVKDDLIIWQNRTGKISEDEALLVSTKIRDLVNTDTFHTLIVDNSKLCGVWSTDVDKVWIDLMKYLPEHVEKTVTICENIINKLQTNYISKQAGTEQYSRAFIKTETAEIEQFLDHNLDMNLYT